MAIFIWNDSYKTGVELIDNQHKKLVDLLNKLDQNLAISSNDATIITLLDELINYTRYHFQTEEEFMLSHGYEQGAFQDHQRGHLQFIAKITAAQKACRAHPKEVADQLSDFLVQWLINHILISDKNMVTTLLGSNEQQTKHAGSVDIMQNPLYVALRESESRFKDLADSLPATIWVSNVQGKRIFVNAQFALVVGLAPTTCVNSDWLHLIHPDDRNALQASYEAIKTSHEPIKIEYRITREHADDRWILETIVPRLYKNGEIAGFMGCGIDISKQKEIEKNLEETVEKRTQQLEQTNQVLVQEKHQQASLYNQLKETQGYLVQSEKMASIGQLAAGVAHEINNPLGYIYSNLNTLQKYLSDLEQVSNMATKLAEQLPADNPVAREFIRLKKDMDLAFLQEDLQDLVKESIEGATRAKKIVQDLRDFSHINKQERELFDIEAGINATLNIVDNELKYKATVVKEYSGIKPIECVGAQLNQVFMNLLVNAAQAIKDFGTITVRTGYQENDRVWIEVEDTGEGMTDEVKHKIFDPFFTTKPVGKGTGLGLSVSYKIIQDHQGEIQVNSVVGKGTRFRVLLPDRIGH